MVGAQGPQRDGLRYTYGLRRLCARFFVLIVGLDIDLPFSILTIGQFAYRGYSYSFNVIDQG